MANPKTSVSENVAGDFFVDATCINCDACRQIALSVFGEAARTSFVKAQPLAGADRRAALRALLSCPTGSIGCLGDDGVKDVMGDSAKNLTPHAHKSGTPPRHISSSIGGFTWSAH